MYPAARFAPSGRLISTAVAGILIFALGFAGSSSIAEGRVKVKVQTSTQKAMLKGGGLKVLVTSKKRAKVTVSATGKGKAGYFRKVKTTVKGRKSVTLPLTSKGFGALGYCRSVPVKVRAGSSRSSRNLKAGGCVNLNLGQNPARCDFLDPTVCLQPFANDYFTRRDPGSGTGKRLNLWSEGTPANKSGTHIDPSAANRRDGFSPGNQLSIKIPGLDTPEALENTKMVALTNLGTYTRKDRSVIVLDTKTGKRHPVWAELDSNPTAVDPSGSSNGGINQNPSNTKPVNLMIRPAVNFEHGRRYVVVLRNLRNAADRAIKAPSAFRVYRDRLGTRSKVVEQRRPQMESIIRTAVNKGKVKRSSLYMAWDFTVASQESVTGAALEIRDDAFSRLGDTDLANKTIEGAAPQVSGIEDLTGPPDAPENENRLRRVQGVIEDVPCYIDSVDCAPGGTLQYDAQGALTWNASSTTDVPFVCEIPQSVTSDGPGGSGTYGHGLLGDRFQIGQQSLIGNLANTVWCAVDWAGFSEEDIPQIVGQPGVITGALTDLSNFRKLPDRMLQGFVNFLYLQRLLIHPETPLKDDSLFQIPSGPAAGQYVIDLSDGTASRGQFMGISQGGIMGGALTALSPDADRGVLGVTGMNYSTLLTRSVDSDEYFKAGGFGLYANYTKPAEHPMVFALMQLLWDQGEANGYAHFMTDDPLPNTPPHEVLLRVALSDHQVSNYAAEVKGRTVGAKMYAPALKSGRHWAVNPYFGMAKQEQFPASGDSYLVYYDSGPRDWVGGTRAGVNLPPLENLPPRPEWNYGSDPHSLPRRASTGLGHAISFLGDGSIQACGALNTALSGGGIDNPLEPVASGDEHCYSNKWNGLLGLP